ncbi:nasopharyngeal carcinoma susceptibility LZ16 [Fusarium albosuccineum]|uniref:Nasopharyngeal carcinoma susceptibility LZ16 n=1 Tax=Fusarium albosuccineum TaxID=1237068 RepID=A0A8H4L6B6_9HYPO|nr:nasopharyngeal carcinoma susceptibility LZ16 [Fusarium albosuccineum]
MPSRKRSIQAVDGDDGETEPSLLQRIRNMWQFANLCQWIYIFGKAAKIPESLDIEEIETECLKPNSPVLADIALALLKLVSSHRGLTHEIFDDQARKQFTTKSPNYNPFGDDESPVKFNDFDIFTKRIEPYGWDSDDRTYFVLDDNRVYRLTEPPPSIPAPKPKKSKTWRGGRRSSKRRRTTLSTEDDNADTENEAKDNEKHEDDGFGGMTWECLAVTLDDVQSILASFQKTRDENEKVLRDQLKEHLIPILEKQDQARKRREVQRERELTNLAKMANAKRSSRIAGKMEQQKQDEKAREDERQRREADAAKRREEQTHYKLEKERDNRIVSREQRLREREARRLQHEEELAQLSEDSKNLSSGSGRVSERRLQVEIEKNKQALKDLDDEEEDWVFDCVCGLYGQVDDGTHSVACERCNVWQHSKCLGIREEEADRPEFQFICASCTHREQEAKRPRPIIKLKLNRPASSGGQPRLSRPLAHDIPPSTGGKPLTAASTEDGSKNYTSNGGAEHGLPLVTSSSNPSHGPCVNGAASSNSSLDAPSPSKGVPGSTPQMTPVIPAPVKLDAGYAERHSQADSPPGNTITSTPMTSVKTPSSSNGIYNLQGDKTIESALKRHSTIKSRVLTNEAFTTTPSRFGQLDQDQHYDTNITSGGAIAISPAPGTDSADQIVGATQTAGHSMKTPMQGSGRA